MKIFCIGRNYTEHIQELNNNTPDQPLVFMKPQTALLKNNDAFYYPNFSNEIHYECELVLKIGKNGKKISPKYASSYIKEYTVGIDFTARDLQKKLKEKGHPWEIAKAFDSSAPIGQFITATKDTNWDNIAFQLKRNNETVQQGNTKDLIFDIPTLISHISTFFTLQTGDLIFTGTPAGVGKIELGDHFIASIDEKNLLDFVIK